MQNEQGQSRDKMNVASEMVVLIIRTVALEEEGQAVFFLSCHNLLVLGIHNCAYKWVTIASFSPQ